MSTDIAVECRAWRHGDLPVARVLLAEAADEIEQLRTAVRLAADALGPLPTQHVILNGDGDLQAVDELMDGDLVVVRGTAIDRSIDIPAAGSEHPQP